MVHQGHTILLSECGIVGFQDIPVGMSVEIPAIVLGLEETVLQGVRREILLAVNVEMQVWDRFGGKGDVEGVGPFRGLAILPGKGHVEWADLQRDQSPAPGCGHA